MIKRVKQLLRYGKTPQELVAMGFHKATVTKACRELRAKVRQKQLNKQKPVVRTKAEPPPLQSKVLLLDKALDEVVERVNELEAMLNVVKDALINSLSTGIKKQFKCDCGAEGWVAMHIMCSKCRKETWWGWWPKQP